MCLLTAVMWLTFSQVFLIHRNEGLDMFPMVKDGDLVLVSRLKREWEINDVVVYRLDGKRQLGRIVAMEANVVTMDDSGILLVNGSVRNGQILYPTYARENRETFWRVPEGTVFALGDHRTQSQDSRDYGCIPEEDILGKVIAVLRLQDI